MKFNQKAINRANIVLRRVKYYESRWLRTVTFFAGAAAENITERFAYLRHAEAQLKSLKEEFAGFPVELRLKTLGWTHWQTLEDGRMEEWIYPDTDRAIIIEYDANSWLPIACWETKVGMLEKLAQL